MPLFKHKVTGIISEYPESYAEHPTLQDVLIPVDEWEKCDVEDLDADQIEEIVQESKPVKTDKAKDNA